MADKLQQGVNVLTTFVAGETPTGPKLNSITAQLRNASQQLEKAVGDIHDQSYPYSSATASRLSVAYGQVQAGILSGAETRGLHIANIARLIGPASALNPEFIDGDLPVTEPVPAGVYEFSLRFKPESGTISFSKNASGQPFENEQALASMAAVGDYHVDSEGRVFCLMVTDSLDPGTVTYTLNRTSSHGMNTYLGSQFNVMPDPNQLSAGGSGCSIGAADASGNRTVTLPTITHAAYDVDRDSVELSVADPNHLVQLVLPQVLTDPTSGLSAGEAIPEGFLLLKNWTTGEVYDTASYFYLNESSLTINHEITVEVDRGDVFCIITVGTDIATSIDDLRRKSRHAHDRNFGEPMVPAQYLTDWTVGPWGSEGSFTKSLIEGNYASQYLHRYGYQAGETPWNDGNAMRGDILMGIAGASPGSYVGSTSGSTQTSSKIAFGHVDRAYIRSTVGIGLQYYTQSGMGMRFDSGGGSNSWTVNASLAEFNVANFDVTTTSNVDLQVSGASNWSTTGAFTGSSAGWQWDADDFSYNAVDNSAYGHDFLSNGHTTAGMRINKQGGANEILRLDFSPTTNPGDGYYYVRFYSDSSTMGSIRGTDASTDPVFYSWHSSNFEYCERSSDSTSGDATTSVTAQAIGHVKYVSGGADYGEWMQAGDVDQWKPYTEGLNEGRSTLGLPEGLIVYVRGGKFYKSPGGTAMVVTHRAIVVGNEVEGKWPKSEGQVLSFIGQVPVFVKGPCSDGDYLIPHETEDGAARAVAPGAIEFSQYQQAIGTAWGAAEAHDGVTLVLCAVGKK